MSNNVKMCHNESFCSKINYLKYFAKSFKILLNRRKINFKRLIHYQIGTASLKLIIYTFNVCITVQLAPETQVGAQPGGDKRIRNGKVISYPFNTIFFQGMEIFTQSSTFSLIFSPFTFTLSTQ